MQEEIDDADLDDDGEEDEDEEGGESEDLVAPSEGVQEKPEKWSFGVDEMFQVSVCKADIDRRSVGDQSEISWVDRLRYAHRVKRI